MILRMGFLLRESAVGLFLTLDGKPETRLMGEKVMEPFLSNIPGCEGDRL